MFLPILDQEKMNIFLLIQIKKIKMIHMRHQKKMTKRKQNHLSMIMKKQVKVMKVKIIIMMKNQTALIMRSKR